MLTLAFLACLHGQCRTVELPFEGGLQLCMIAAQQTIVGWLAEHPGWVQGGRYRCTAEREA